MVSHAGTFRFPAASREAAQRLLRALSVEAQSTPHGTRITLDVDAEPALIVVIEADSSRSLRAAANSMLRLVAIAVDVDAVGEPFKPSLGSGGPTHHGQ